MSKKIYAFIFARKHSVRLKNKNLQKIKNKTLVEHSIIVAKKIKKISKIFVSSDSPRILKIAKKNGVCSIKRPNYLCKSNSKEIYSWKHAVNFLKKRGDNFDYFISLPPTSPLRNVNDIKKLINKFERNKSDITLTVTRTNRYPFFNIVKRSKDGRVKIAEKKKKSYSKPNCFFDIATVGYITRPKYILKTHDFFSGKVKSLEIPRERAIDIDDTFDFKIASILKK
jgi:N-acylneuraminate cytidylyltransferase